MALISKFGIDDVYKQLKDRFRRIRAETAALSASAAAGNVSFSTITGYMAELAAAIEVCDQKIALYSGGAIEDYARAQEELPSYTPGADYSSMKSAAQTVLQTISDAVPQNSAFTVVNNRAVEPVFTPAQTATLRTQLDALVATIAAP